jgi:hypothetical protein
VDILLRDSSIPPCTWVPHDWQRVESWSEGWSLLTSHRGQTRESGLDAKDELLISHPFFRVVN